MASGHPPLFDPRTVHPLDWATLAAGLVAFFFSFVSYYSTTGRGVVLTANAWHGFFGWFATLMVIVGAGVVVLENFLPHVTLPLPNRILGLAAYSIATVCVVLALFIVPETFCYAGVCADVPSDFAKGHSYGYWVSLVVIVAGLVLSLVQYLRFHRRTGTRARLSRP